MLSAILFIQYRRAISCLADFNNQSYTIQTAENSLISEKF